MGQVEVLEVAVVESLAVLASPTKPSGDRGLTVVKDAHRGGDVESFGQSGEDLGDPTGGGLEPIQGGMATGGEGAATSLAAQGLDAFTLAVGAIADERVDLGVADPVVVNSDEEVGQEPG